jgi:hypothetical protein
MVSKDDKPPTSKDEADARRVRPPPEKYDPDERSDWSITETVAWIIWRDLDAVRNEWDDYRNECADWKFEGDPRARALRERVALDNFERALEERRRGQTAPSDPDLQKKIQEKLEEFKEGSWHRFSWKPSGWRGLRDRAISKNLRPQDAIDELWQAAREGQIKATALQYENAKALLGDPIEIPAHYWPYLKPVDDPLTGKAMLTDDQGRVYREVKFRQLVVKELWPKSPPLSSGEHAETWPSHLALIQLTESTMWSGLFSPPCAYSDSHRSEGDALEHVEKPEPEQTRPAEPKLLKPAAWFDDAREDNRQHKNESQVAYAGRLHDLMQKAHASKHVTKLWAPQTLLRRLFDK